MPRMAWLVSEGAEHDRAGYILLALLALRIVWGFVVPPHAPDSLISSVRITRPFFTRG
jgi:cytochrome b